MPRRGCRVPPPSSDARETTVLLCGKESERCPVPEAGGGGVASEGFWAK